MKPLGKCLKIASRNHRDKETAIRELLLAYRTTPHPATGLSPGEMLFRHGFRGAYPNRKACTDEAFDAAVDKMKKDKSEKCNNINKSVQMRHLMQPFNCESPNSPKVKKAYGFELDLKWPKFQNKKSRI